ncbi:hypothetical protein GCM10009682_29960 [Luedemannella flava]|uniref:DUF998 domain-containing protein n=1 Tax=Luedemannella flava TaxID=349316 RepID=A0ABP4YEX0_9ACTN
MTPRTCAVASLLSLLVAVVATVFGHIGLGPGYDPLTLTVSDYALSDRGAAIEAAMVALALGAPALPAGLVAAGARVRVLPVVLVGVWSVGLVIAALVPTDPVTATSMSTAAYVHRYASVSAFVVLPVAVCLLARLGLSARTRHAVTRLGVVCIVGLGVFWYVSFPGDRVLMGLVERVLIGVELLMLAVLSVGLLRAGPLSSGRDRFSDRGALPAGRPRAGGARGGAAAGDHRGGGPGRGGVRPARRDRVRPRPGRRSTGGLRRAATPRRRVRRGEAHVHRARVARARPGAAGAGRVGAAGGRGGLAHAAPGDGA